MIPDHVKGFIAVLVIIALTIIIDRLLSKVFKKGDHKAGGIIEPSVYPEYHGEYIERIKPTIETQYGRDLFHASIKMYKYTVSGPGPYDSRITKAVRDAEILLSEVNEKCHETDRRKYEEAEERSREITKEFMKGEKEKSSR